MFDRKPRIADFTSFYGELLIDEVRGLAIGKMFWARCLVGDCREN
jgi:hypothetical protein